MTEIFKNISWFKVILLCAVFTLFTGITIAEEGSRPNLPMALSGDVTIGGAPAPEGTLVSAKVGEKVVGVIEVETRGLYGNKPNGRLPVSANKIGTLVDLYVNNVKVDTIYYVLDTGLVRVDLNAPASATSSSSSSSSSGGSGSSDGGDSSGGGVTGGDETISKSTGSSQDLPETTDKDEDTSTAEDSNPTNIVIPALFAVAVIGGLLYMFRGRLNL